MGQAKQRGTLEQRQAEGVARKEAERKAKQERLQAEEDALTPEQRAKRKAARLLLTQMMGFVAGSQIR